ncbi:cytochrome c [Mesorhizobium sp. VK24D]|uniref:Cytochrome c n=1 Tax=Mesorhizobium album TaxID=3072314 RepID=A0ABU4XT85_9HYPH|nr:cytochrome c [Mesorhizobium sp. VK24D]MDX8477931.1 cytochrome c [Mesorhizobium sp. VK24D]
MKLDGEIDRAMDLRNNLTKYAVLAVLIGAGVLFWRNTGPRPPVHATTVAVQVPQFSPTAFRGKAAFDKVCAACHGVNASGTEKGPPFINEIYNPGHHSDDAFFLAAKFGVRQHHWPYGNMPPQPQVSEEDVAAIVQYVRELQLANGIRYMPHTM